MPMLTMDTGTPLYRPVMVVKPRSELSVNGRGETSRAAAIPFAREGDPTVTYTTPRVSGVFHPGHFTSYVRYG